MIAFSVLNRFSLLMHIVTRSVYFAFIISLSSYHRATRKVPALPPQGPKVNSTSAEESSDKLLTFSHLSCGTSVSQSDIPAFTKPSYVLDVGVFAGTRVCLLWTKYLMELLGLGVNAQLELMKFLGGNIMLLSLSRSCQSRIFTVKLMMMGERRAH